ncbi:MAG: prepilin-type N-terminal cleavage/methylation domain-containing protein [Candidatus Absconditabacterales bacterium]
MKSRRGFTLLEIIISMTIFLVLFVIIISLYTKMMKLRYNIQARQSLIESSYNAMEKINLLLKDYTIDYEEYFNRQWVGCNGNSGANFTRNTATGGYCPDFTAYGNGSPNDSNSHQLYYCNSSDINPWLLNGSGCAQGGMQSFGEYTLQFRDINGIDVNVEKGPDAIADATGVQELYLISQDGKQRIYLRRILVESGDRNNDGAISGDSEYLYTLQMLKLRGFDAGDHHTFNPNTSSGVYDGNIDTRACDYAQGFLCNGSGIDATLYSGYRLPLNTDDGRVNLFDQNLTVSDRNLVVSPTKNPDYALAQPEVQINPYFTISLTNKLYGKIRQKKLGLPSLDDFQLSLQTSFSTKSFYTK